jgi:hypothetical protein
MYIHEFAGSESVGAFLTKYCLDPLGGVDATLQLKGTPIIVPLDPEALDPVP